MRLFKRDRIFYVEFTLPDGQTTRTLSTHESRKRAASAKATAIVEAECRTWVRQEDEADSRDNFRFEAAIDLFNRKRMLEPVSASTLEIDGQNERYLLAAVDGVGQPFFRGRLVREITGPVIVDYVTQALALGLVPETVSKRLSTLRKILRACRKEKGSDGRPLVGELPDFPALGVSRDPDGWGRALSREEAAAFLAELPAGQRMVPYQDAILALCRREGLIGSAEVAAELGISEGAARAALTWATHAHGDRSPWLYVAARRQTGERGMPAKLYAPLDVHPRGVRAEVDQRGWASTCLWTAMHPADVNTFTPDLVNLTDAVGPAPLQLPPRSFLWRNTKNRRRAKVRDQVRKLPAQLKLELERMERERGFHRDVPIAGHWDSGNMWRAFRGACERAGIPQVLDDRGRPHWVSASDLRRTAATWLAEEWARGGTGDKTVIELIRDFLGHRDDRVARNIYDRATGTRLDVATETLDRVVLAPAPRKGPHSHPAPSAYLPSARRRESK